MAPFGPGDPSFPWTEEGLAIARHKPHVHIDKSGWWPKYFPQIFVHYANAILKKKMLFASDWRAIPSDRWLKDAADLPIRDEVRPFIPKENARRILKM